MSLGTAAHFDRSALPPARTFYESELGKLSRPSRGWARTTCPVHQGSNKTAFAVNLESGGFFCFNCGVKGGDLVDFVQLRDKCDFKRACQILGAWQDRETTPAEKQAIRQLQRKRQEQDRKAISLEQAERDLRLHYRNEVHTLERARGEAEERMQNPAEDIEQCWQALAEALPRLREAIAAYYLLSFATVGERLDFTLHPDQRASAIQAVMLRGNVRDDHGVVTEVDFPTGSRKAEVCDGGVELMFP